MTINSLYQHIADQNITVNTASEPPPVIKSDVSQYANILAKKSYLNKRLIIKEENNVAPAPAQAAPAQPMVAQKPNLQQLAQAVAQKYATAIEPVRSVVVNVLNSLLQK